MIGIDLGLVSTCFYPKRNYKVTKSQTPKLYPGFIIWSVPTGLGTNEILVAPKQFLTQPPTPLRPQYNNICSFSVEYFNP
jgi:hypothetical protein